MPNSDTDYLEFAMVLSGVEPDFLAAYIGSAPSLDRKRRSGT